MSKKEHTRICHLMLINLNLNNIFVFIKNNLFYLNYSGLILFLSFFLKHKKKFKKITSLRSINKHYYFKKNVF